MHASEFDDLFVLELASNHWGSLERGLKIINDFGLVVRNNGVHAALKLQFRDVDTFVHASARNNCDLRYVKKTLATQMPWENYRFMMEMTRQGGMVTMATPFDEISVGKCVDFGVEVIKIASSDIQDWFLVEAIAATGKPTMISTGGAKLEDIDRIIAFFDKKGIPLGVNHCVSLYPSEDSEIDLNQIDFLRARYPGHVIGLSTHEYHDWRSSLMIAYAKGARTFERHVDIDYQGVPVSPYCSLPHQVDEWFKAFLKAKEMCGAPANDKREAPLKERQYLANLARGVYARRDLPAGHVIGIADVELAIPLHRGQISSHELMLGERVLAPIRSGGPINFADVDSPRAADFRLESLAETPAPAAAVAPAAAARKVA